MHFFDYLILLFIISISIVLVVLSISNKKIIKTITCSIIIVSLLIVSFAFAYRPDALWQLLFGYLFFIILFSIIANFFKSFVIFFDYGIRAFLPFLFLVLSMIASIYVLRLGHSLSIYTFKQRLPQYEKLVQRIKSGDLPDNMFNKDIPEKYKHLAYVINTTHYNNDRYSIVFLWGSGFPLKHTAFLYVSDERMLMKKSRLRKDWPARTRINENWYRVSD